MEGYLYAALAATLWGSYLLPLKLYPQWKPASFLRYAGPGIVGGSWLFTLFFAQWVFSWQGFIAGLMWTIGGYYSFVAVQEEGLARATARWVGSSSLIAALAGIFILKEQFTYPVANAFFMGTLVLAIILMARLQDVENSSTIKDTSDKPPHRRLIPVSILTGLAFGTYLLPLQSHSAPLLAHTPAIGTGIGIGIIIGALLAALKGNIKNLIKESQGSPKAGKSIVWGAGAGLFWISGNTAATLCVASLGMTQGYPLTQMALFVSILWGVFAFRELKGKRLRLFLYALLLFGANVGMGISKNGF
jgi:glucose uptake protein